MTTQKSVKVDSTIAADMVAHAQARAADDKAFKALLVKADHAGKVAGAMTNSADAKKFWREIADDMARCALVTFPAAPDAASKPDAKAVEMAHAQLRDSCALVNVAIKSAQSYAKRLAVESFKASEMANRAKRARDSVIKLLTRQLEIYGVRVNFQTGKAEPCEAKEPAEKSGAQVAEQAVDAGAGADFDAFVDALCKLAPDQLKTIRDRVGAAYDAWLAEQATDKALGDVQASVDVKTELNTDKAKLEARNAA